MPLGIKPTVDFAFKKIFGSPENSAALLGLLNAILDLDEPIETVEVLNPFSYQEFEDSKLIVLDVRCRDSAGRMLNVEMQVSAFAGFIERLVYYASSMYVDQLTTGGSYAKACPAISIGLLGYRLFVDTSQPHHRFEMIDRASGRTLENAIEVHTIELTKYNLSGETIAGASKLEQWVFLLLYAQDYEADDLEAILPGIEFKTAIDTIEIISEKTKDKQMYDQRERALRDYEWGITGAREEGRREGREEGRQEGEQAGLAKGKMAGQIQLLQQLLGDEASADRELQSLDIATLESKVVELQQRLRDRQR